MALRRGEGTPNDAGAVVWLVSGIRPLGERYAIVEKHHEAGCSTCYISGMIVLEHAGIRSSGLGFRRALLPERGNDLMAGELILYTTEDGKACIRLRAEDGTVWLSQLEMAELLQTSKQNVSLHVKNVLAEAELIEAATVKNYLTVQIEGGREVKWSTKVYNLDMILAVGYRVRSLRGTQFRQWATAHLREYLIKGFVMDDEHLKEPGVGITSTNCSSVSGTSGHPRSFSIRRFATSMPLRSITMTNPKQLNFSSRK